MKILFITSKEKCEAIAIDIKVVGVYNQMKVSSVGSTDC